LESALAENEMACVGWFDDFYDGFALEFKSASLEYETKFIMTNVSGVLEKYVGSDEKAPTMLFSDGNGTKVKKLPERMLSADINVFIKKAKLDPVVQYLHAKHEVRVVTHPTKIQLWAFVGSGKQEEAMTDALNSMVAEYSDKLLLLVSTVSEEPIVASHFGIIEGDTLPQIGIRDITDGVSKDEGKRYKFNGDAHALMKEGKLAESLKIFAKSYFAGGLAEYVKSAADVDDSTHSVKTLTSSNWAEKVAANEDVDVCVLFYNRSTPTWMMNELAVVAEKFSTVTKSVMIASFDLHRNDYLMLPSAVTGYVLLEELANKKWMRRLPALYMFNATQAGRESPIRYIGDIESESVLSFVKSTVETIEVVPQE
jgi:hypothetical protein